MGICFKIFGKTIIDGNITDCTGSAFFVAEHYLLTSKHVVNALSPGVRLDFKFGDIMSPATLAQSSQTRVDVRYPSIKDPTVVSRKQSKYVWNSEQSPC